MISPIPSTFSLERPTRVSSSCFTTSVFNPRSDFFRAARSFQWLSDPQQPVDLTDEDPATFERYMNCVYFGIGAVQIASAALEREITEQAFQSTESSTTQSTDNQHIQDAFILSEKVLNARIDRYLEEKVQLDVQVYGQMDALIFI